MERNHTHTYSYNPYLEDAILHSNPLGLVVALYEGAIDSCVAARNCLASRDIPGRTRAINKILGIFSELMCALNDEKGGEISRNLRRLYVYMQSRVTEAHQRQTAVPLEEVEALLSTMLDGWKGASAHLEPTAAIAASPSIPPQYPQPLAEEEYTHSAAAPYGGYSLEALDFPTSSAFSY